MKIIYVMLLLLVIQVPMADSGNRRHRRHALAFMMQHQPVSINSAAPKVLKSLRGIGPTLSKNIYHFIVLNGPFRSLDELIKVPGLSLKRVDRIIQSNPGRVQL